MPIKKKKFMGLIQNTNHPRKTGPGVFNLFLAVGGAMEAGGLTISRVGSGSAKDYGPRLTRAGFVARVGVDPPYQKGDIAVIDGFTKSAGDGIKKDHVDGHLAMYDGTQWISDFK